MKVIEPLFLNELNEEFETAKYEPKKLQKLLERLGKIKIFDPACGSGNFLIIAYKELRFLEIKILIQLQKLQQASTGFEEYQVTLDLIPKTQLTLAAQYQPTLFSRIELAQFFGIELDDFAHEIAILSLWLAQHQMNQKFKEVFCDSNPTLPLQAGGNIVHGNATRVDWEVVCPKKEGDEIYILGNPPYLGSSMQSQEQKDDMTFVFKAFENYKNLDFIAVWFLKGAEFIFKHNAQFSFVSTNSICQGEQVGLLWPYIINKNLEISFAHQSFKWSNNAKSKAAVIVVIIGVRNKSELPKFIIKNSILQEVKSINPYLTSGNSSFVFRRGNPVSDLPEMMKGNYPTDDGNLILTGEEKNKLIEDFPISKMFIKKFIGSQEFINNIDRWCLWIDDKDLEIALSIPYIRKRIENVSEFRKKSKAPSTREKSNKGHKFIQIQSEPKNGLIVPSVSSERRNYIPVGFVDDQTVVNAQCLVVYNPPPFIFSIVTSRIHMVWVRAVAGRLKSDYRYSSALCFYSFPFPLLSERLKNELIQCTFRILEERENYSEKTLAQLYDPDKMPEGLKEAHRLNDLAVERCYRSKPFESDEERLEYLFKLYEKMIAEEKVKNTLFEVEQKTKKTKKIK